MSRLNRIPTAINNNEATMQHYIVGQPPPHSWKTNVRGYRLHSYNFQDQRYRMDTLEEVCHEIVNDIEIEIEADQNGHIELFISRFEGLSATKSGILLKMELTDHVNSKVLKVEKLMERYEACGRSKWLFHGSLVREFRAEPRILAVWQEFFNYNANKIWSIKCYIEIKKKLY